MSLAWVAEQIQATKQPEPEVSRFNPRPRGVVRPGSATDCVLAFLRAHPGRFFRYHEILARVGRSKVAVDWALAFLRDQGLVQRVPDPARNSRYYRYAAKKLALAPEILATSCQAWPPSESKKATDRQR